MISREERCGDMAQSDESGIIPTKHRLRDGYYVTPLPGPLTHQTINQVSACFEAKKTAPWPDDQGATGPQYIPPWGTVLVFEDGKRPRGHAGPWPDYKLPLLRGHVLLPALRHSACLGGQNMAPQRSRATGRTTRSYRGRSNL